MRIPKFFRYQLFLLLLFVVQKASAEFDIIGTWVDYKGTYTKSAAFNENKGGYEFKKNGRLIRRTTFCCSGGCSYENLYESVWERISDSVIKLTGFKIYNTYLIEEKFMIDRINDSSMKLKHLGPFRKVEMYNSSDPEFNEAYQLLNKAFSDTAQKDRIPSAFVLLDSRAKAIEFAEKEFKKYANKRQMKEQVPFTATKINCYWIIRGTVPKDEKGTGFLMIIDMRDDKIVKLGRG